MNMACIENMPPLHADSEMEEGEIVDDLSDISSEEEFLLRQRLQVLENYNNVLERKKAKRSSIGPGTKSKTQKEDALLDLSEISATELEEFYSNTPQKQVKVQKRHRTHHRQKRKKLEPEVFMKTRDHKRKIASKPYHSKKKVELKIISESSEESEDEYRNRRRKLADAVVVNKNINKNDKTSLSERLQLQKIFCGVHPEPVKPVPENCNKIDITVDMNVEKPQVSPVPVFNNNTLLNAEVQEPQNIEPEKRNQCELIDLCNELIDLCTDEDSKTNGSDLPSHDVVDSVSKEHENEEESKKSDKENSVIDSDDDLELLRQHALRTKNDKNKLDENEHKILFEDEDSDTTELRLICLKSALLKKAIERKQKQKLKKRLSQSMAEDIQNAENNTDIESVDMDIGSDDDKVKETPEGGKIDEYEKSTIVEENKISEKDIPAVAASNNDELEEDEDLLRAKLLTSLSKNLPNLVNPNVVNSIEIVTEKRPISPKVPPAKPVVNKVEVPEEKRIIINLGESDSEGEHEATKNLTKMHMKLSEQVDFQQRLDMFLKSARMEVEKTTTLPDVVQQPPVPKKNEKFVAKAVNHLPKSEQIEYKNLVKRMAELEKIKQARQSAMTLQNKIADVPAKETLKPRNAASDTTKLSTINNLEEKIKLSRKNIADESAKILKLKEEGLKLCQKFKIVATELRNIKTAMALNKKQTRSVQNRLTQIRLHHQMLLKSSMTSSHSKVNNNIPPLNPVNTKLQKENNPAKDEYKHPPIPTVHKTMKVIVKENNQEIGKKPLATDKVEPKNTVVQRTVKIVDKDNNELKDDLIKNRVKQKELKAVPLETEKTVPETVTLEKDPPHFNHPRLSVQLDMSSNRKVVKIPDGETSIDHQKHSTENNSNEDLIDTRLTSQPLEEKGGGSKETVGVHRRVSNDDYRSPLDAFGSITWEADPNAILCPFEVGGDCKDADCKYLHTMSRSK